MNEYGYDRTCTELIERGNEGLKWTRPSGVAVCPIKDLKEDPG